MFLHPIPTHDDPCWRDTNWRTATLLEAMRVYGLQAKAVGDITGHHENTVWMWRNGSHRPVPALALRVLLFELKRLFGVR